MKKIRFEDLQTKIEALQNDFNRLEHMTGQEARSSHSDEILGSLVTQIQHIVQLYGQDFTNIPEKLGVWTADEGRSLIERLRKACRYVDACDELLRAARRNEIFSNIDVKFVDLQFNGPHLQAGDQDATDRLISSCCSKRTMSQIAARCGNSEAGIRRKVREELGKKARVHAEIQLLLHYEEHPTASCPRVVCSSKSACYLCQLFFDIHGQYHIPSSHGKLYDTWKWPGCLPLNGARYSNRTRSGLTTILPRFSQLINDKLNQCLKDRPGPKGFNVVESPIDVTSLLTPSVSRDGSSSSGSSATHGISCSNSSVRTPNQLAMTSNISLREAQNSMASALDSSSSTVDTITVPAKARQESRSAKVAGHSSGPSSPPTINHVLTATPSESLLLQAGESRRYKIERNTLLKIFLPGMHIYLKNRDRIPENSHSQQPLLLDAEYLPSLPDEIFKSELYLVDLDEGDWVERSPPEGVLFLPRGLVLKRRSTVLRLHIVPSK